MENYKVAVKIKEPTEAYNVEDWKQNTNAKTILFKFCLRHGFNVMLLSFESLDGGTAKQHLQNGLL